MSTLFGKLPKLSRVIESKRIRLPAFDNSLTTYVPDLENDVLEETVSRVLQLPAVASKMFLITIGVTHILSAFSPVLQYVVQQHAAFWMLNS